MASAMLSDEAKSAIAGLPGAAKTELETYMGTLSVDQQPAVDPPAADQPAADPPAADQPAADPADAGLGAAPVAKPMSLAGVHGPAIYAQVYACVLRQHIR